MNFVEPVLKEFRSALEAIYGERDDRIVLFGSRARGEHTEDSDCDVAVFFRSFADRWVQADKIAAKTAGILLETGLLIHAMPYRAAHYPRAQSNEIRGEPLEL